MSLTSHMRQNNSTLFSVEDHVTVKSRTEFLILNLLSLTSISSKDIPHAKRDIVYMKITPISIIFVSTKAEFNIILLYIYNMIQNFRIDKLKTKIKLILPKM